MGEHISLGICVGETQIWGETHIPATLAAGSNEICLKSRRKDLVIWGQRSRAISRVPTASSKLVLHIGSFLKGQQVKKVTKTQS